MIFGKETGTKLVRESTALVCSYGLGCWPFSDVRGPLKRLFCLVRHWEELPIGLAGCSPLLDLPEDIR
jgi:hypothetical protein